ETEFCGQRLRAAFRRKSRTTPPNSRRRPYSATLTLYNVVGLWNRGNYRRSRGLPGGAEGIIDPSLTIPFKSMTYTSPDVGVCTTRVRHECGPTSILALRVPRSQAGLLARDINSQLRSRQPHFRGGSRFVSVEA